MREHEFDAMALGSADFIPIVGSESDSALGCWKMCGWTPRAGDPLHDVVAGIWYFDGTTAYRRERVFPTAKFEIVVQFDTPHRPVVGGGCDGPFPSACLSGLQVEPMVIEAPPDRMRVLGLRLHLAGAFQLLGFPLGELTGSTVHIADLLGTAGTQLEAALHDAPDGAARVRGALEWVTWQLERTEPADRAIAWAIDQIERDPCVSIGALQRESGHDRTRFVARFRATAGASPKQFARVIRLRNALALLRSEPAVTLGDAALHAGYYDQPHMNGDFREMTGLTPGEFRSAVGYPEGLNTAE